MELRKYLPTLRLKGLGILGLLRIYSVLLLLLPVLPLSLYWLATRLHALPISLELLLTLCVVLAAYFGFILVLAFSKETLSGLITDGLSVGIPIGLFVILLAWGLTGAYVFWANSKYDNAVNQIRQELKRSE